MDENTEHHLHSTLIVENARENAKTYQQENLKTRRQMEEGFFQKSHDYRDFVLSPEGYEGIVVALYILTIPYLTGLLFLFLLVAKASYEYFLQFNLASFFVIWAIGYEVCAALILIGIFLAWLKYISNRWSKEQARKKASTNRYGL